MNIVASVESNTYTFMSIPDGIYMGLMHLQS